jgi:hypothetical protein
MTYAIAHHNQVHVVLLGIFDQMIPCRVIDELGLRVKPMGLTILGGIFQNLRRILAASAKMNNPQADIPPRHLTEQIDALLAVQIRRSIGFDRAINNALPKF